MGLSRREKTVLGITFSAVTIAILVFGTLFFLSPSSNTGTGDSGFQSQGLISQNQESSARSESPCTNEVLGRFHNTGLAEDSTLGWFLETMARNDNFGVLLEDFTWHIEDRANSRCTISMYVNMNGENTEYYRFYINLEDNRIYGDNRNAILYAQLGGRDFSMDPP